MITNRDIDHLILSGPMAIEQEFALGMLSVYLEDLTLLRAGAGYADLGIGERRAKCKPGIIQMNAGRPLVIQDPKMLRDFSKTPKGSFAHLRLQGVMRSQDGASHQGINTLIDQINLANANDRIEGILLEVNSGGGEATAAEMLMSAIDNSPKAVVTYAHLSASGAVEGTLPSDEIIASNSGARFGSIGTMMTLPKGYADYHNRNYQDIYADKSTNKNKAFREFLGGNLQPLKDQLNETNEVFHSNVQKYRTLKGNEKTIEHTLSGAMFSAKDAKRRGLIDGIGGYEYALKRLTAAVKRRKS